MNEFNKTNLNVLRSDIEQALMQVCKTHNIDVKVGSMRFTSNNVDVKLSFATSIDGGKPDIEKTTFEEYSCLFGIKKEVFGQSFDFGGDTYKVVGIKPKSRKYPIVAENNNGTRYKLSISHLPHSFKV